MLWLSQGEACLISSLQLCMAAGLRARSWVAQFHIDKIREDYERAWESARVQERQMGVALYFIDKLALRAGHEKDDDEADTVGCCNLKVDPPGLPQSWAATLLWQELGSQACRALHVTAAARQECQHQGVFGCS